MYSYFKYLLKAQTRKRPRQWRYLNFSYLLFIKLNRNKRNNKLICKVFKLVNNKELISPGLEPGTLCVWSTRDNHYTTKSHVKIFWQTNKYISNDNIQSNGVPLQIMGKYKKSVSNYFVKILQLQYIRFRPGSNQGPCACKAHVITTTPRNPYMKNVTVNESLALY